MVALHNGVHMGLDAPAEPAPVILAGLHHHRKVRQLGRTGVNVQPVQVVFHNAGHRLAGGVAVSSVNLHEHIKQIGKDMPGAAAGVDDPDLLRRQGGVLSAKRRQLRLHLRLLRGLLQIIVPLWLPLLPRTGGKGGLLLRRGQQLPAGVGVALQPQAAQRVLHHVPHDPVRREQLGGGGNVLLCDFYVLLEGRKHLVLFLAVVILVQPADDLHRVPPVLLGNHGDHPLNDAALPQQIVREQQLGIVRKGLEHLRQNRAQRIALGHQQVFVQLLGLLALLQGQHPVPVKSLQLQMDGLGENLRPELVVLIGEHPHMAGQIPVHLHEPQRAEPVEPGVGGLLHDLGPAVLLNPLNELAALGFLGGGQQPAVHAFGVRVRGLPLGDAVLLRFHAHAGHQLPPRPHRILFDAVLVHFELPVLPNCFSRNDELCGVLPLLVPIPVLYQRYAASVYQSRHRRQIRSGPA